MISYTKNSLIYPSISCMFPSSATHWAPMPGGCRYGEICPQDSAERCAHPLVESGGMISCHQTKTGNNLGEMDRFSFFPQTQLRGVENSAASCVEQPR